jgi:3-hydroxyacyl-[acyl-carrier-protein] dehydratase
MRFRLVDSVAEESGDRIVARKLVTLAEEYLADHFPGYPVLPGVLMLESMVQAARRVLRGRTSAPLVLGEVRALKYGAMVRPGDALEVEVTVAGDGDAFACRGSGRVLRADGGGAGAGETAVSGRFTMRPVRITG